MYIYIDFDFDYENDILVAILKACVSYLRWLISEGKQTCAHDLIWKFSEPFIKIMDERIVSFS